MPRTTRPKPAIYQMKVTLKGTRPPIWRRFQVRNEITLGELHNVLQVVMGWYDEHLHSFRIGQREFGVPDPEWGGDDETQDEERAVLGKVMTQAGTKLRYEYDFGDGWEHEVLLEKILPAEEEKQYPVCLAGRRRCPLEDCGGVWGWANLIGAVADPNHPDHEELSEWTMEWTGGQPLDAEAFDLDAVNRALRQPGKPDLV
ncbi:MAG TPA: plasmid pRiA4b ORF-3 family protein [Dehalococcoidia bacterium]|nr:plasmid pRiA4b ORF-3 family protein [Dehalococcoidia bacterium]